MFAALDGGAMVLPAAPARYRSNDSEYRYRPDSEAYYVSGLEEPEALIVLADHADRDRFVVFARARDPAAEQWSGARLGVDGVREHLGADRAFPMDELEQRLPALLHGARSVHYRLGRDVRSQALVLEALRWSRGRGSRSGKGPRSIVDPGQILDGLRVRKDPRELDCMRRAAAITESAFRRLAEVLAPNVGEWELESILESRFRDQGGEGPAFATIVGAGENACILHYVENRARVGASDLVLVDAGAEVDFYAADVTRTFPASGRFNARQREVIDVVSAAHRAGVAACRPGEPVSGVHEAAVAVLAEGLRSLGLVDEPVEQILAEKLYKPFYPHQTSHWLGLDVHEPGDYAADGQATTLEADMVLTVEPGLYFPPSLGEQAGAFLGMGVRLEDDVLVTSSGPEVLTGTLPIDGDGIEALVGNGRSQ